MAQMKPVTIENARIGFRNFEGREGKFNKAGDRSFAVFLDRETADAMHADGWNIKFPLEDQRGPDPDAEGRDPYLIVSVGFEFFAANVFLVAGDIEDGVRPTKLTEHEVGMLDWAELTNVDLVLRPYEWTVNRNSGIKAYLKSGYFTIDADPFASKYGLV